MAKVKINQKINIFKRLLNRLIRKRYYISYHIKTLDGNFGFGEIDIIGGAIKTMEDIVDIRKIIMADHPLFESVVILNWKKIKL